MTETSKPLTYISYLKLDELLRLQQPRSAGPEHDEMLFIVIHQVYELWFHQVLHELRFLRSRLRAGESAAALAALRRILTILKTLVAQVDVIETMTPMSFNSFRTRLDAASGFQSHQFRELEFVLGHRRKELVKQYAADSDARSRLEAELEQPALFDAFLEYLGTMEYLIPASVLRTEFQAARAPSTEVQDVLLQVYRDNGFPAQICERLVDLDEGLQEWRYRHVKMVERTIGSKPGTGGSSGVGYLRDTLFRSLFPDLWEIRSRL